MHLFFTPSSSLDNCTFSRPPIFRPVPKGGSVPVGTGAFFFFFPSKNYTHPHVLCGKPRFFSKTREGGAWPARGEKNEMSPLRTKGTFFLKKTFPPPPFPFLSFPPAAEITFRTQGTYCTTLQRRKRAYIPRERPFFPRHPSQPHFSLQKKGK